MEQEVDLIKFAKGVNQDGFVDRIKKLEDEALKTTYRLNKIESDEDIVRIIGTTSLFYLKAV